VTNLGRILLGLALTALPLVILGWRNWRALPLGGLIMAFTAVGSIGAFAVGALGPGGRAALVATLVVIAALFLVNVRFVANSSAARNAWGIASFAAWFVAVFIYIMIPGPAIDEVLDERNRVAYEELMARNAAEKAAKAKADSANSRPTELPLKDRDH
jgi:CBS domain containing-hemolysin-like protein